MIETDNETTPALPEIHSRLRALERDVGLLDAKVDRVHDEIKDDLNNLLKAFTGESVLGRYAVSDVEERLISLENRMAKLEKR